MAAQAGSPFVILNEQHISASSCECNSGLSEKVLESTNRFNALAAEIEQIVGQSLPTPEQVEVRAAQWISRQKGQTALDLPRGFVTKRADYLDTQVDRYLIPYDKPLGVPAELAHHELNGKHLWIGVLEGTAVVLDGQEHALFLHLLDNRPISDVVRLHCHGNWSDISRLIGRIAKAGMLAGIAGYHEVHRSEPNRFARLHLTKVCQLECIHCYADSSPHVDRDNELPFERWRSLITDFAAIGGERLLFTGGEALIYKGCIDLIQHAKAKHLHVTLFSNGLLVPRYASAIRDVVDQVQISLDGPDEQTNDLIRGPGTYNKILHALDLLLSQGTKVRVGMTTMDQNWEQWKEQFLAFVKRFSGTQLQFKLGFGVTRHGRAADMSGPDFNESVPIAESFTSTANDDWEPRITRSTSSCGYCEQLVVGPDGTVYPCHLLDAPIGHIDSRPLPDLVSMLTDMARLFSVDYTDGCKTCDIRYLCGGTCRVMNGKQTGSRLITTCFPNDKQRRYRNLVEFFGRPDTYREERN